MKTIGIIGGMGPLAGLDLFQKIIENTEVKKEQDHLKVIIDSNAKIPDRTAFIMGKSQIDPSPALIESAKKLEAFGADFLLMACNTAHFFYENINKEINIPFLHIIKECAKACKNEEKLGLLATTGSYKAGIYKKIFEKKGCELIEPSEDLKKAITKIIYNYKAGLKIEENELLKISSFFYYRGAKSLILGCTELPLIFKNHPDFKNFYDPNKILARHAISYAGATLKNA